MSSTQPQKPRIQVRAGIYQGRGGWHILGRDSSGSSVRIFSENEQEARRMAAEIRAGKQPRFDSELERSAAREQCFGCSTVERLRSGTASECFCTSEQLERKRASMVAEMREQLLEELTIRFEPELRAIADRVRETAEGLRAPGGSKAINPWHAANRLDRIADQIINSRREEQKRE